MTEKTPLEAAQAVVEFLPKHYLPALLVLAMSELKQAIAQEQTPKILMVGANGHFKELSYEVAHDGNFLVRPSNFEQEHEIVRRCVTCKHFAIRNRDKCRSCDKDYCNWEPKI